jgi:hypothetical protein
LKVEKIKHGRKTLAECGGIRGVDDTSSFIYELLRSTNNGRSQFNSETGHHCLLQILSKLGGDLQNL